MDFTTDSADTLTLDVAKDGGGLILVYEAFSLSALAANPQPNLNIESSFSFSYSYAAETSPVPFDNNGQETLTVSGVTYTALYDEVPANGEYVDVFIATGQSNAYWGLNEDNSGKYEFGQGVQAGLTASGRFSNPTVIIDGVSGQQIAAWYDDSGPAGLYNSVLLPTVAVPVNWRPRLLRSSMPVTRRASRVSSGFKERRMAMARILVSAPRTRPTVRAGMVC